MMTYLTHLTYMTCMTSYDFYDCSLCQKGCWKTITGHFDRLAKISLEKQFKWPGFDIPELLIRLLFFLNVPCPCFWNKEQTLL